VTGPDANAAGAEVSPHALPCGVVSFDDDGRVLFANATLGTMLGRPADEIVGRHVEGILTVAGRIFYQTHFFPLLRLHGEAREIFLLLRRADGGEVGALVNAVRREREGVGGFVSDCVLVEVRERRKYEDELLRARRAAEAANAELAARSAELELANERLREQALELELQQQTLQEQAHDLEAHGEELRVMNDELLARSEELERARAAADEANRAKSEFLATMSHELRTPLNAIGGYVELIELGVHGPVTAAQHVALDRVARAQRHLLRLINELLNLARIESGRVDYAVETMQVADVIAAVTPLVEPQRAAAGLALAVRVEDGLAALGDREKVQQVLINLLTNAIKFTPAGGRVTVDARHDADGRVRIDVADTGIGVSADKVERIFEPFVQVPGRDAARSEGTGLGLAGEARDRRVGVPQRPGEHPAAGPGPAEPAQRAVNGVGGAVVVPEVVGEAHGGRLGRGGLA
jgi:signal transduction histidine kinase